MPSIFAENMKAMPEIEHVRSITLYENDLVIGQIPNVEGKKNSLKIYCHLLGFKNGTITKEHAQQGLTLYGEYVSEAEQNPGKHPNIDFLFDIEQGRKITAVIEFI